MLRDPVVNLMFLLILWFTAYVCHSSPRPRVAAVAQVILLISGVLLVAFVARALF